MNNGIPEPAAAAAVVAKHIPTYGRRETKSRASVFRSLPVAGLPQIPINSDRPLCDDPAQ